MKPRTSVHKKLTHDESGAALVEFSILLPVLFTAFFGMIEFGRVIYQNHVAEKGVKSAARYLARVIDATGCPMTGADYTNAEAAAKTLAQYGGFDSSAKPVIAKWDNASDITISISCTDNSSGGFRGEEDLPIITVSTTFQYQDLGMLSVVTNDPINITASHQELFIGG